MFKKMLIAVLVIGGFFTINYYEHNYTRENCEIVSVKNGVVRFEDKCGMFWDWDIEPNEHFEIGDKVDLKMYDNFTSGYVCDDEITKIVFHD